MRFRTKLFLHLQPGRPASLERHGVAHSEDDPASFSHLADEISPARQSLTAPRRAVQPPLPGRHARHGIPELRA